MKISIIGSGYVGLVTSACLSELGNRVICTDNDKAKIGKLKTGVIPIYEPGLSEMLNSNVKRKRLVFNSSIKTAVVNSEVIFICVGTPPKENGEADLTAVENVARQIAKYMTGYRLVIDKSTVPVETGNWVKHTIQIYNKKKFKFDVASNPEFLREGSAIEDFMHPDRIVVGVESKRAKDILLRIYRPLKSRIVTTDIKSAELIKHASNSYLAMKISFINALSQVCEKAGADIECVAEGIGLDKRIGRAFLNAGIGYGGFCFPKDTDAFIKIAEKLGYNFELLRVVRNINEEQKRYFLKKIEDMLWIIKDKKISVWGLSFKPNTDDMRFAPSIDIISALQIEGAKIKAYDPCAMKKAANILKGVKFCKDAYNAAKDGDCLIILTEWDEFKEIDLKRVKRLMRRPLIIDGRNIYDPKYVKKLGFRYTAVGRSTH